MALAGDSTHVACVGTLRGKVIEADDASLARDRDSRAQDQPHDGCLPAGKVGLCSARAGEGPGGLSMPLRRFVRSAWLSTRHLQVQCFYRGLRPCRKDVSMNTCTFQLSMLVQSRKTGTSLSHWSSDIREWSQQTIAVSIVSLCCCAHLPAIPVVRPARMVSLASDSAFREPPGLLTVVTTSIAPQSVVSLLSVSVQSGIHML